MAEAWGSGTWGGTAPVDRGGWGGSIFSGGLVGGGGGGGGGGACTAPHVENFNPPEGTEMTRSTPIQFDLMSECPLVALMISVVYRDTGATEVVYNSEGFSANFRTTTDASGNIIFLGSERQLIEGGWHFIIRRRAGWPFSPSMLVEGSNDDGQAIVE